MTLDELPEPKPGHVDSRNVALPFGESVYLIVRHDGKMVGVEPTRHDAAWTMEQFHDANEYDLWYGPVGSVPVSDLSIPERMIP